MLPKTIQLKRPTQSLDKIASVSQSYIKSIHQNLEKCKWKKLRRHNTKKRSAFIAYFAIILSKVASIPFEEKGNLHRAIVHVDAEI